MGPAIVLLLNFCCDAPFIFQFINEQVRRSTLSEAKGRTLELQQFHSAIMYVSVCYLPSFFLVFNKIKNLQSLSCVCKPGSALQKLKLFKAYIYELVH